MSRVRLVILTDQELRSALKTEASARGMEMSELAAEILRAALTDAIKQVQLRQSESKTKAAPRN